jgi:hypothetical protein
MPIKLHPAIIALILIGVGVLLFALLKGCKNSNQLKTQLSISQAALDSVILNKERDSMASVQHEKDYKDSLQFANGQLDLTQSRLETTQTQLLAYGNNAAEWKRKYESVRPEINTTTTLVPNEFINDCHDCFDSLDGKNRLIGLYIGQVKEANAAHEKKEKLQENRIIQVINERDTARKRTQEALITAKKYHDALEPKGKLYFTISAIGIQSILPNGIGAGLKYKDKRDRLYGAKVFGSKLGRLYEAETSLPLSFRRKPKL